MPGYGYFAWRDSKRWLACQAAAATQMIAEGWNKHARKFHDVKQRRASQLYRKGTQ